MAQVPAPLTGGNLALPHCKHVLNPEPALFDRERPGHRCPGKSRLFLCPGFPALPVGVGRVAVSLGRMLVGLG
jgi:hypothetical protein